MREYMKFYVDGAWVDPVTPKSLDVINPANEQVAGRISAGSAADVDKAVKAARRAFETFSQTSREERIDLLQRIQAEYQKRFGQDVGVGAAAGGADMEAVVGLLQQGEFRARTQADDNPLKAASFSQGVACSLHEQHRQGDLSKMRGALFAFLTGGMQRKGEEDEAVHTLQWRFRLRLGGHSSAE